MREIRRRLEAEVKDLERELIHELPREIQKAREMGDLRENAEYKAALERQSFVQGRIGQLRQRLADLSRFNQDSIPRDQVHLGSLVEVRDLQTGEKTMYEIVISEGADPSQGRISNRSPIGQGLMGKQVGDEVQIAIPSGNRDLEIVSLKTIHEREPQ